MKLGVERTCCPAWLSARLPVASPTVVAVGAMVLYPSLVTSTMVGCAGVSPAVYAAVHGVATALRLAAIRRLAEPLGADWVLTVMAHHPLKAVLTTLICAASGAVLTRAPSARRRWTLLSS